MVEVKATDANTSVILDDELRHWDGSEGQRMFGKYFPNRDEAKEYCNSMLEQDPNVVFWIYEENREPERIFNEVSKDTLVDESRATPWGFWATIGLSSVVVATTAIIENVIGFVFGFLAAMKNPGSDIVEYATSLPSNGFFVAMTIIFSAPICTALTIWFIKLRKNSPTKSYLGLLKPTNRQLVTWVSLIAIFHIYFTALPVVANRPINSFLLDMLRTVYFPPTFFLAFFFMAPIWEEIVFRGFLFQGIRCSRLGLIGAIGITSLAWSLMHLPYGTRSVIHIFILGVLLGFARYKTGSTYLTMVMHSLNNFVSITAILLFYTVDLRWLFWFSATVVLGLIAVGISHRVFAKQLFLEAPIKNE